MTLAASEPKVRVEGWTYTQFSFLNPNQFAYVNHPYKTIDDILNSPRPKILVVAGHQDDEIIGMAGTMRHLSDGLTIFPGGTEEQFTRWSEREAQS